MGVDILEKRAARAQGARAGDESSSSIARALNPDRPLSTTPALTRIGIRKNRQIRCFVKCEKFDEFGQKSWWNEPKGRPVNGQRAHGRGSRDGVRGGGSGSSLISLAYGSLTFMLGMLWRVVTFPFRLLGWVIDLFGRLVAVLLGFALMVIGMALCASSLMIVGVPVFVIGLILAMKSL